MRPWRHDDGLGAAGEDAALQVEDECPQRWEEVCGAERLKKDGGARPRRATAVPGGGGDARRRRRLEAALGEKLHEESARVRW
jgi:hypothetical protein